MFYVLPCSRLSLAIFIMLQCCAFKRACRALSARDILRPLSIIPHRLTHIPDEDSLLQHFSPSLLADGNVYVKISAHETHGFLPVSYQIWFTEVVTGFDSREWYSPLQNLFLNHVMRAIFVVYALVAALVALALSQTKAQVQDKVVPVAYIMWWVFFLDSFPHPSLPSTLCAAFLQRDCAAELPYLCSISCGCHRSFMLFSVSRSLACCVCMHVFVLLSFSIVL